MPRLPRLRRRSTLFSCTSRAMCTCRGRYGIGLRRRYIRHGSRPCPVVDLCAILWQRLIVADSRGVGWSVCLVCLVGGMRETGARAVGRSGYRGLLPDRPAMSRRRCESCFRGWLRSLRWRRTDGCKQCIGRCQAGTPLHDGYCAWRLLRPRGRRPRPAATRAGGHTIGDRHRRRRVGRAGGFRAGLRRRPLRRDRFSYPGLRLA